MDYMNQRVSCMKFRPERKRKLSVCNACRCVYVYISNEYVYIDERI